MYVLLSSLLRIHLHLHHYILLPGVGILDCSSPSYPPSPPYFLSHALTADMSALASNIPTDFKEKKNASDVSVDVRSTDADSIKFVDESNVENRRQIGLFSAIFIIFNRIIGTG